MGRRASKASRDAAVARDLLTVGVTILPGRPLPDWAAPPIDDQPDLASMLMAGDPGADGAAAPGFPAPGFPAASGSGGFPAPGPSPIPAPFSSPPVSPPSVPRGASGPGPVAAGPVGPASAPAAYAWSQPASPVPASPWPGAGPAASPFDPPAPAAPAWPAATTGGDSEHRADSAHPVGGYPAAGSPASGDPGPVGPAGYPPPNGPALPPGVFAPPQPAAPGAPFPAADFAAPQPAAPGAWAAAAPGFPAAGPTGAGTAGSLAAGTTMPQPSAVRAPSGGTATGTLDPAWAGLEPLPSHAAVATAPTGTAVRSSSAPGTSGAAASPTSAAPGVGTTVTGGLAPASGSEALAAQPSLTPEQVALLTWAADMIARGEYPAPAPTTPHPPAATRRRRTSRRRSRRSAAVAAPEHAVAAPGYAVAAPEHAPVAAPTDAAAPALPPPNLTPPADPDAPSSARKAPILVGLGLAAVAMTAAAVAFGPDLYHSVMASEPTAAPVAPVATLTMPATVGDLTQLTGPAVDAELLPVLGLGARPSGVTVTAAYATDADAPLALAALGTTLPASGTPTEQITTWAARMGATTSEPVGGSGALAGITCTDVTGLPAAPEGAFCVWSGSGSRAQAYVVGTSAAAALDSTAQFVAALG